VSHAVRTSSFGDRPRFSVQPAYLPNVGDVYLLSPHLLGSRVDRGPASADTSGPVAVVVIAVPKLRAARIQVVTRAGSRIAPGIPHGAAPQLGLPRPGVWTSVASVDKSLWTPHDALWRGPLERVVFEEVLERFQ
jgi:hypothetical protein